ncbi:MAG: hypothetical protein ETSY1_41885 [Candidatus Entotheonella factor]|uniref:Uncharacterized protein n=1 Tax=Entotheonella factor TaxID=1429438 RepID=W4L477_ENTF1|nr:MAG: hypothetical protein ETSY1_41885 [Candidatus Entotheonella factor]
MDFGWLLPIVSIQDHTDPMLSDEDGTFGCSQNLRKEAGARQAHM